MYTAASTAPALATSPKAIFVEKVPKRIRSSPMKLDEPGMASVASATIRNSPASTGARNAIPPIRDSDSDPRARAESAAMIRKSGPTTSPWLTIWSSAPWAPFPCRSSAKIPSRMNPSWATEEYPTTSRASSWENARTDPYRIDTTAITIISSW